MLLRNYDNIMSMCNLSWLVNDTTYSIKEQLTVKNLNNVDLKFIKNSSMKSFPIQNFSNQSNEHLSDNQIPYGYSNLIIGSGDTSVTYDDYKLSSILTTSQVSNTSHTNNHYIDEATGNIVSEYKKVFTALEDIEIKEIGILSSMYTSTSSSGSAYNSILVYREVLEQPIQVPMGANAIITFKKIISANPNKPADYVASASIE